MAVFFAQANTLKKSWKFAFYNYAIKAKCEKQLSTIFEGCYRSAKSNLRPSKIISLDFSLYALYNIYMLTLEYCEDEKLKGALAGELFPGEGVGCAVALLSDGVPCGLAEYALEEGGVRLKKVGIVKGERGKGYGDFFTRALVFKFMQSGMDILVDGRSAYFENLGFKADGKGGMRVSPDEVVFPSQCKHHREENK